MRGALCSRTAGALLVAAALCAGAAACSGGPGVGVAQPAPPANPANATAAPASGDASQQASASSPTPSSPPPSPTTRPLPMGGTTLFPGYRIVAYYGAAGTSALGVLGDAPPEKEWPHLAAAARAFDRPGRPAVPAYELIADVEQGAPGRHHDYVAHVPDSIIADYLATVRRHHGLLILDVQPGRDEFLPLVQQLRRWLVQPDVELALDPEWKLYGDQRPDVQIGHTDAAAINAVSGWLSKLVLANHLPQKMLLVHQFTPYMVRDKKHVMHRTGLALVFNMDGFGGRAGKLGSYRILYHDPRFYLGFKLFYRQDVDRFTPAEVVRFVHSPDVVEYQ